MKWIAGSGVALALLVGAFLYASSGYFQLEPDEAAVVLRLGRYNRSVGPGPHFHLRFIEHVERQRVIEHREEFGFVTLSAEAPQEYEDRPSEKRMLTGDTNVVDVEFVVVWQIVDLADYSFNTERVPQLIRDVAQASMREIVAQRPIDGVLTSDKGAIAESAKQLMQSSLDDYGAGVQIQKVQLQEVEPPEQVKDAFREVISAEQDKERLILEARGYADQVVPEARGQAEAVVNGAKAYKQTRILGAQGEAARFNSLLAEYEKAPEVTRERLYIETLESILPGMEKIIVEEGHADRVLPYLPVGRTRAQ